MIRPAPLLRFALIADAAASGAMALMLAFGAGLLAPRLGLPDALLRNAGLFLIGYAALVGVIASRAVMKKALVWAVIAVNVVWVMDSIALLVGGWASPSWLGLLFVAAQAAAVGVFAELQFVGLRRSEYEVAA